MIRTTVAFLISTAMVFGTAVTVSAQGKKASAPKPQHVTTSKPTTTKTSSPKTTSGPKKTTTIAASSKGPKTTTKPVKSTTTSKASGSTKSAKADTKTTTKVAKADAKTAKADAKSTKKDAKKSTTDATTASANESTSTTTSGDSSEEPVTLTKVQQKLEKNTKLAEKLLGRMPPGTDLAGLIDAAEGFRNLGQFVAAVNVSYNHPGITFDALKTLMVDEHMSLGQALQKAKFDVANPTLVAQQAETDAQTLITQTEAQTSSTTTVASNTTTSTTTTKTKKSKSKAKKTLRTQSGS